MGQVVGRLFRRFALAGATIFLLVPAGSAAAAPGALDPSFGSGGVVLRQLGAGSAPDSAALRAARQGDGKIVVAGSVSNASLSGQLMLARLNPDGSFDTTFGSGGVVLKQLGAGSTPDSGALGLALQPDGKIVVAGEASDASGNSQLMVARLNSDGSFDTTFGSGSGVVLSQLGAGSTPNSIAFGLALQSDGKIVVSGGASDASGNDQLMVARLNPDGSFDTTFHSTGVVLSQLGASGTPDSDAAALALQGDGKIVVGGGASDASGNSQLMVVRLNPDGSFDTTFNSTGVVLRQLGAGGTPESLGFGLALQGDGKIVVGGGASDTSGNQQVMAARLNSDGSFDTTFNSTGVVLRQLGAGGTPDSFVFGLALQGDGKIVLSGGTLNALATDATQAAANDQVMLARLDPDGGFDTSFGTGGVVLKRLGAGATPGSLGFGLALQPDGKIVLAGGATDANGNIQLLVARFLGDPPPTATFGFTPTHPNLGQPVDFDASASSDAYSPIVSYFWNFGDGTTGSGMKPTHAYTKSGSYTVTLLVLARDGLSAVAHEVLGAGPPSVMGASESHKRFRAGNKLPHISTPVGTTFSFTLGQAARVTLTFKHGKHTAGKLVFNGHAGVNKVAFDGRLSKKHKLKAGAYTLRITATAAGESSTPVKLKFTIVK